MSGPIYTEKHLGPVVLRVRLEELDLYDLVPNPNQPRMGPFVDEELRRNILENKGLMQPILAEPHQQYQGKFQIIDGQKRWENCKILVEVDKRDRFRKLPVEICDQTLTEEERLRAWINLHIHRSEWSEKEKERTAYRLIQLVDRVRAANIMGISVRVLDKLKATFELSERMTSIPNPDASISYAREIMNLAKYIRTSDVVNAIVKKVNEQIITSSKEVRGLRGILKDESARAVFLQDGTTVDDALKMLPSTEGFKPLGGQNFIADLGYLKELLTSYKWTKLLELKGKPKAIQIVQECKKILESIETIITT